MRLVRVKTGKPCLIMVLASACCIRTIESERVLTVPARKDAQDHWVKIQEAAAMAFVRTVHF